MGVQNFPSLTTWPKKRAPKKHYKNRGSAKHFLNQNPNSEIPDIIFFASFFSCNNKKPQKCWNPYFYSALANPIISLFLSFFTSRLFLCFLLRFFRTNNNTRKTTKRLFSQSLFPFPSSLTFQTHFRFLHLSSSLYFWDNIMLLWKPTKRKNYFWSSFGLEKVLIFNKHYKIDTSAPHQNHQI